MNRARLWERYLSDRTGVDATEWHVRAEEREHKMTAEDGLLNEADGTRTRNHRIDRQGVGGALRFGRHLGQRPRGSMDLSALSVLSSAPARAQ